MTKRELLKKAHVRNEQFVRELRPILELMVSTLLWRTSRTIALTAVPALSGQAERELLRIEVALVKELVDRLQALIDEWPNAVWFFFPDTGHGGRIRLVDEFYRDTYPAVFPEKPVTRLRSSRVKGRTWCGVARRIRKDTAQAFMAWDEFKAGDLPMTIARRSFSSRSPFGVGRRHLMRVCRRLERASELIYGPGVAKSLKSKRLIDFSFDAHLPKCVTCQKAKAFEQMCVLARDYVAPNHKD